MVVNQQERPQEATPSTTPKTSASRGVHSVPGQRPRPRALHHRVDVGVHHAVQRVGAAGGQGAADQGGQHQPDRRHRPLGGEHRRNGGDQQQFDDARLGQRDVGADGAGPRCRGRDRRRGAVAGGPVPDGLPPGLARPGGWTATLTPLVVGRRVRAALRNSRSADDSRLHPNVDRAATCVARTAGPSVGRRSPAGSGRATMPSPASTEGLAGHRSASCHRRHRRATRVIPRARLAVARPRKAHL